MSLSKEEIRLLDLIEQDYLLTRLIPSADVCNDKYAVSRATYRNAFRNDDFLAQLDERGIIVRGVEGVGESGSLVLTPIQLAVLNAVLDLNDNRSTKKKLADFKVSSTQYEGWLRDPAVQHYLRERAEGALSDNQHEAHLALIDRVKQGDVPAIKYYNEITGRYAPGQTVDIAMVLTRVTEIIMRNVRDPEIQSQVADELLALAAGVGIAARAQTSQPKPLMVKRELPAI